MSYANKSKGPESRKTSSSKMYLQWTLESEDWIHLLLAILYYTVNDWSVVTRWSVTGHSGYSWFPFWGAGWPNTGEPGPVGIRVCPTFRIPRRKVNLFPPPHNPLDVILTWPVNSCRTIKPTGSGKRVSLATGSWSPSIQSTWNQF